MARVYEYARVPRAPTQHKIYLLLDTRPSRDEDQADDDIVREEADNLREGVICRARCVIKNMTLRIMSTANVERR